MRPASSLGVVLADNPSAMTLDGTRTFIVGVAAPVVIDPGPDEPQHLRAIRVALAGVPPEAILLTHLHPDHAAGARGLSLATGAPIHAGGGGLVAPETIGAKALRDGETIATDRGELRVVATPGHTPEHLVFHWTGESAPRGGAAFVGDLMMGVGDTTLIAPPEGDVAAYLASLDRVEALGAGVLYPAHGPAIDDPAGAISRHRAHRHHRIDQVRAALAAHPDANADALVGDIYGDALNPALRPAAAASVSAMLQYLRGRGA